MITYPIVRLTLNEQIVEFSDADIIEANIIQEISPISTELPVSEARIRIRTTDPRFEPFSNGEFYNDLSLNSIVNVYEYYDSELPEESPVEQLVGRFYLKEWRNPKEGEFEFICQDAIGLLDTIHFDGTFWGTNTTLGEAVRLLLDPTGIAYSIEAEIQGRQFKGYLTASTVREALKQVLFAGKAFAMTAFSNLIIIRDAILPMPGINPEFAIYSQPFYGEYFYESGALLDGEITTENQTAGQTIELKPLVTQIQLSSHDFTEGDIQEVIYSSYLEPGQYKILYSKPYYNVTAEGVGAIPAYITTEDLRAITTEDGRILSFPGGFEFGINYIFLNVLEAGNVIVRGYPYIDSIQAFIYNDENASNASPNIWKVSDAMLISAENASELLTSLVRFAKLRYLQKTTLFPPLELLPGDIAKVQALYDKFINGIITRIDYRLTGGLLTKTELIGVERIDD